MGHSFCRERYEDSKLCRVENLIILRDEMHAKRVFK